MIRNKLQIVLYFNSRTGRGSIGLVDGRRMPWLKFVVGPTLVRCDRSVAFPPELPEIVADEVCLSDPIGSQYRV